MVSKLLVLQLISLVLWESDGDETSKNMLIPFWHDIWKKRFCVFTGKQKLLYVTAYVNSM